MAKPYFTGIPEEVSKLSVVGEGRILFRRERDEKFLPGGGRAEGGLTRGSTGEADAGLGRTLLSWESAELRVDVGGEKLDTGFMTSPSWPEEVRGDAGT